MSNLREIAHGMEDQNLVQQNYNASLHGPKGKRKLIEMAAQKARLGNPAPSTKVEVNHKGPHVERYVGEFIKPTG